MALQLASYRFSENDAGAEVCLLVQNGIVQSGQTFRAGYGSIGVTASESFMFNSSYSMYSNSHLARDIKLEFRPLNFCITLTDSTCSSATSPHLSYLNLNYLLHIHTHQQCHNSGFHRLQSP